MRGNPETQRPEAFAPATRIESESVHPDRRLVVHQVACRMGVHECFISGGNLPPLAASSALDRIAFLAARRFAKKFENLLKAFDLSFGFIVVFFECSPQLLGRRSFGHFWQGFIDLLFSVVDVLQGIQKQRIQIFCGHGGFLRGRSQGAALRRELGGPVNGWEERKAIQHPIMLRAVRSSYSSGQQLPRLG